MTIPPNPSFSRSGRSVAGGKNIERVSADVPEALLCDLNDAVELIREHTPTATRDMDRTEISGVEEIRRGIRLWTKPGQVVASPFAGIGSEGHVALQMDRKFIGAELKESYYRQAARNLEAATIQTMNLFSDAT